MSESDTLTVQSVYGEQNTPQYCKNIAVTASRQLSVMAGRQTNATINVVSPNASLPPLTSQTEAGGCVIGFTPSVRGRYELQLQIGGIHVGGSPFSLYVTPSPETRGRVLNTILGVKRPFGLAIDQQGQLIVAEYGRHCITTYSKEGEKVQSFGLSNSFTCPSGVALTDDGHILVTDWHRLLKLTPDGRCIMSVGGSEAGSGPLQFDHPRGIAVHPTTGQIYVANSNNHRIQVINDNFTYSHSFGTFGTQAAWV